MPTHRQKKSKYGVFWHDFLMPIGQNYNIIERAVYITAWSGCNTIWIVCSDDNLLLLRKMIGSWIYDPESVLRAIILKDISIEGFRRIRKIPIYYVPIHPKDVGRRDGLVWSVLWGAKVAYTIGNRLSTWVQPDSYFVYFPQTLISIGSIRKRRVLLKRSKNKIFYAYNGKTIRDGELLPFTFNAPDFNIMRDIFYENSTGHVEKTKGTTSIITDNIKELPVEERYSGRFMKPETVFGGLPKNEKEQVFDVNWECNVDNWEDYLETLRNPISNHFLRPYWILGNSTLTARNAVFENEEEKEKYVEFIKKEEKNG